MYPLSLKDGQPQGLLLRKGEARLRDVPTERAQRRCPYVRERFDSSPLSFAGEG